MTQTTTFDRLIGILRPLALIALIAWASSGHIARAADRDPAMPSVVGEVVPRQGGEIAAAIAAPVERVSVVAGDRVQAGQDLAQLNIDDRRADFETSRVAVTVRALIPVENPLTRTRTVRFTVEGSPALAVGQPVELYLPEYEGG